MRNVLSEHQTPKECRGIEVEHYGNRHQPIVIPGHQERINVLSERVEWSARVVGDLPQMDPAAATALDKAGLIFVRDLLERWDTDRLGLLILPGMGERRFAAVERSLKAAGLLFKELRDAA